MTYSRSRNQLIVFGGESKSYFSTTVKNDVHTFDIGKSLLRNADPLSDDTLDNLRWHHLKPSGEAPVARRGHTAVMRGDTLWIMGGDDSSKLYNDFKGLDLGK